MKPNPALERDYLEAAGKGYQYPLDWDGLGRKHKMHRQEMWAVFNALVDHGMIEMLPPVPYLLRLTDKGAIRLASLCKQHPDKDV